VVDLNSESEIIRLVETGNITELAKQISKLLEDDESRENLSKNAYQYAIQNFNNEAEAKKMIEAYRKVMMDFKIHSSEANKNRG